VNLKDDPEKMSCPKCGAWQDAATICGLCGIVIEKYLTADISNGRMILLEVAPLDPRSLMLGD
jgi:uncharacterized membrane-anchored protein